MKVALGVSGGIACYKSAEILRGLKDRGVEVVVLMTRGATHFVTPLTFRALSGNKVYVDIFEGARSGADFEGAFDHILVAHSTAFFLVAPATADCIARLAIGLADDFLTTFHLAVTAPVVVAPAMNTRMWEHASVRANIETLKNRGVHIIEPEVGQMACRTYGPGRLAPVEEIVEVVMGILNRRRDLEGRKILVTAGPTVEDIDPVRYISNRSSGKMGYALAQAAQERGAQVTLVSGPIADATELHFPNTVHVRTTEEMRRAVVDHAADAEVVIKAAAPLDFRPERGNSTRDETCHGRQNSRSRGAIAEMNRNEIAAQLEFFKDIGVDSVDVAAVGAVGEAQARQRAASRIDRPGAHRAPLQLDAIRAEIGDCQRCKLAPTRTHLAFGP